jgi:hypothetical protein
MVAVGLGERDGADDQVVAAISEDASQPLSNPVSVPDVGQHWCHIGGERVVQLVEEKVLADAYDGSASHQFPLPDRRQMLACDLLVGQFDAVDLLGERRVAVAAASVGHQSQVDRAVELVR